MLRKMFTSLKCYLECKKGQGMVEYALIIALIAVVLIVALTDVEGSIAAIFGRIGDTLDAH